MYAADLDHKATGAPLQTVTKDISELGLTGEWFEVTFDNYPNILAGNYCLVVAGQAGSGNTHWRSNPANPYPTGVQGISSNGGSTWFTYSTSDFLFEIWYDDGIHRIPVIHDFSWQPPVQAAG